MGKRSFKNYIKYNRSECYNNRGTKIGTKSHGNAIFRYERPPSLVTPDWIGFIRGNADLLDGSGRISSMYSIKRRPRICRDRRGWCGSARRLPVGSPQVFGQVVADGSPGSAWSARICSAASGRISSRRSARWRLTVRRDRHGWRGRCGSVRRLQKLKQTGTKKRVFCPWVFS